MLSLAVVALSCVDESLNVTASAIFSSEHRCARARDETRRCSDGSFQLINVSSTRDDNYGEKRITRLPISIFLPLFLSSCVCSGIGCTPLNAHSLLLPPAINVLCEAVAAVRSSLVHATSHPRREISFKAQSIRFSLSRRFLVAFVKGARLLFRAVALRHAN